MIMVSFSVDVELFIFCGDGSSDMCFGEWYCPAGGGGFDFPALCGSGEGEVDFGVFNFEVYVINPSPGFFVGFVIKGYYGFLVYGDGWMFWVYCGVVEEMGFDVFFYGGAVMVEVYSGLYESEMAYMVDAYADMYAVIVVKYCVKIPPFNV